MMRAGSKLLIFTILFLPLSARSQKNAGIRIGEPIPEKAVLQPDHYFKGGNIFIIPSSHQDIGWEDTPEACREFRDHKVITPALKRLGKNPDYRFSMEYMLMLMEYLERNPERKEDILEYTRSGQLEWGGTYNQPYEGLYTGEALVRQTYLGRKWLKNELPGCDTRTAWNPDVPARTMQMPQILSGAGIKYLNFSRYEAGFYDWESPDGSRVHGFSSGQYYHADWPFNELTRGRKQVVSLDQMARNFEEVMIRSEPLYRSCRLGPSIGIISSKDLSEPLDIDERIDEWNRSIAGPMNFPKLRYGTFEEFMEQAIRKDTRLPVLKGEWPNLWLYIHGPTHHKTVTAGRAATRLLTTAEKLASFADILDGPGFSYPCETLEQAWSRAIYPDHGWGGHNGHITDRLFHDQMTAAGDSAAAVSSRALEFIISRIGFEGTGIPITVFNPLSWERTDLATCSIDLHGYADVVNMNTLEFKLVDADGREIPYQVITDLSGFSTQSESMTIIFPARKIPPLGYRVYYLKQSEIQQKYPVQGMNRGTLENDFYKLQMIPGGIASLYDKDLETEFLAVDDFLGAELFQMPSVGSGAGEFTRIQQPVADDMEKLSQYAPAWNLIEHGPVRTTLEAACLISNANVRMRVMLYHPIKRVDIELDLLGFDGMRYREFRLAFPLKMAMSGSKISYAVPMAVATVGESEIEGVAGLSRVGLNYDGLVRDYHPREVQDWFGAHDGKKGLTVSSSVAAFDWIEPGNDSAVNIMLQPLLLASRRSCNGKGNWYYQAGDHSYRFNIYTHKGDWKENYRKGMQPRYPLIAVAKREIPTGGHLPEQLSFMNFESDHTVISAVKKAEDGEGLVIRLVNLTGTPERIRLQAFFNSLKWQKTNLIEEESLPVENAAAGFEIRPFRIETFQCLPHYNK